LSFVEPNLAFELVNSRNMAAFSASWPPADSRLASSQVCQGVASNESCTFINYGTLASNFDHAMAVTIPQLALQLSQNRGGSARILLGAYSSSVLFPGSGVVSPLSQVLVATVVDVDREDDLGQDPLLFAAVPTSRNSSTACGYWTTSGWGLDGCQALADIDPANRGAVQCQCSHMTHFGMVNVGEAEASRSQPVLDTGMRTAASLAFVMMLVVAILYLVRCSKMSPTRIAVLNLALSAALFFLLFAATSDNHQASSCQATAMLTHFFLLAAFGWTLALGLLMLFGFALPTIVLPLAGYALPTIVILVASLTLPDDYGRNRDDITDNHKHCFVETQGTAVWFYVGPMAALASLSVVCFLTVICFSLCCWKQQPTVNGKQGPQARHSFLMALANLFATVLLTALALACLLGVNGEDDDFWPPLFTAAALLYVRPCPWLC
jgi:hypothetical protein